MVDIMTTWARAGATQLQQSRFLREDEGYSSGPVEGQTDNAQPLLMSMARTVQSPGAISEEIEMAPHPGSSTVDASTCMFWCAVALGALVQGRPTESVSGIDWRRLHLPCLPGIGIG